MFGITSNLTKKREYCNYWIMGKLQLKNLPRYS
jgi:hypothetical protein